MSKQRRSKKRIITLILRSIAIILLIAILSGITYIKKTEDVSIMILADLSDSTLPVRESMSNFTRELLSSYGDKVKIGIMVFAENSVYKIEPDSKGNFINYDRLKSDTIASATNIEDALNAAASKLGIDVCGRIILLSDGKQTEGEAVRAAVEIAYRQIRVDSVLFNTENSNSDEVQINNVDIPANAYTAEPFTISVTVKSSAAASGRLTLYDDGASAASQDITIQPGINTYTFQSTAAYSGVHTFRTELETISDSIKQNNTYYSYIKIAGSPNILLIDGTGSESSTLLPLLEETFNVTKVNAHNAPSTLSDLQRYDEVILMNASMSDLPGGFDTILNDYVQKLGRGVFTTGGDNTYFYGKMKGTKFEDLLPVNIEAKGNDSLDTTALVILIDSSSSMAGTPFMLAKQGAINCVNALNDTDYIGIISFAAETRIVSELTSAKNRDTIDEAIEELNVSKYTYLYEPVCEAYNELKNFKADKRHMIILSDGNPEDTGYADVVTKMKDDGITTSTIMIGDIKLDIMENLAFLGGGKFYQVFNVDDLPDVMLEETESVISNYTNEEVFTPKVGKISGVLSGIDTIPELGGYITTSIKDGASNVLYTDKNRPVYAEWKYGLGNVASFTSDLSGVWSNTFLSQEQGVQFVKNVVSSLIPNKNAQSGLTVNITRNGSQAVVQANSTIIDENSTVETTVVPPSGNSYSLTLNAVSPGVYTNITKLSDEGVYTMLVQQSDSSGNLLTYQEAAVAAPYSAEYDAFLTGGETLLTNVSNLTGGNLTDDIDDLMDVKMQPIETEINLYIPLAIIAALLLLTDLVLRNAKWKDLKAFFRRRSEPK
jgi:Mg-chelatase subunit ChlD